MTGWWGWWNRKTPIDGCEELNETIVDDDLTPTFDDTQCTPITQSHVYPTQ